MHLNARLHAFYRGLFQPSVESETRALYAETSALFQKHTLATTDDRTTLAIVIADDVCDRLDWQPDEDERDAFYQLVVGVFAYEELLVLPDFNFAERHSTSEYWELCDALNRQKAWLKRFDETYELVTIVLCHCVNQVQGASPVMPSDTDGITVPSERIRTMTNPGSVVEGIVSGLFDDDLAKADLFARHRDRLERNIVAASGGNPADPSGFNRQPRMPTKSDIRDPRELVDTYLDGTPIAGLFAGGIDVTIPTDARFEHHHIIAGSGHGKTQTLQYLIGQDLETVASGNRSIVVLDSQGDLIRNISNLAEFAPGGPLHDRIVIIDPTDVEWPVSLNLFDVGIERLAGYAPLERERLTNSILELYDFVLGTLLSAEMTQKQNVIFRYVTRLMLHIPDATIHTLRELMEPRSEEKFSQHIRKLTGTARHFFETEFSSKEFEQTKKQVLRRLWGILENQTFERMFSHPRSKLDLFSELNAGKVILINTAKDLLKETGTQIFGRFFIAMIAQAAQERSTLPENKRMPTFVYIDEAADYFDRNIGIILAQARKYNVGMVLAHQYLGQLDPKLQEAFAANTSIKFAGGVSARDARALASMLYCDPSLIETQPKGSFAVHMRGVTKSALPLMFPFGYLENKLLMSKADRLARQKTMRARYAVHYTDLAGDGAGKDANEQPDEPEIDEPDDGVPPTDKPGDGTDPTSSW